MASIWFVLVALMLIGYAVLDGFDLGAGALYVAAARNEEERTMVLRAIGPVWDGNEVWLIAAGGTLFYAFPLLYASSFSGFYLPLNIVLWLLDFPCHRDRVPHAFAGARLARVLRRHVLPFERAARRLSSAPRWGT